MTDASGTREPTLVGKAAFVTGGASGIGEACVRELVAAGARVMIADRSADAAEALAADLGDRARWCAVDVTDERSVGGAVDEVVRVFGGLDIAVNSAGVGVPEALDVGELAFSEWRRVLAVNLDGAFLCMRAELEAMLRGSGGSIVNIASVMGVVGTQGAAAYISAKHGLVGLTKAAALEYATRGIRVNVVAPGHVSTPMFTRRTPEQQAAVAADYPMQRVARPEEVARLVCFVAGGSADFMTGASLPIDGGYLAR